MNLAFFSGNEVFWKTRWEDAHRTLVSYKETHANAKIDPDPAWTGTWRDPRAFNPERGQPENALTGTMFTVNAGSAAIRIPAADGKLRFWRGHRRGRAAGRRRRGRSPPTRSATSGTRTSTTVRGRPG